MNATRTSVNVSLATALTIVTALLVGITPTDASAQSYVFSNGSSRWQYMGFYDDGGLAPVDDFRIEANPWTDIDGDGGAIGMGQEGFTPASPTGADWLHGDLNSPKLAHLVGRSFGLRFDITGAHMDSTESVYVQAVILVKRPNDLSDRRIASSFRQVPIGEAGAWDTQTFAPELPAGTVVKQINLRIFVETSAYYKGWILVDNVELR